MADHPTLDDTLGDSPTAASGGETTTETTTTTPEPASRAKRILKTLGWIFFTLFCLISFTILKLPEDRVRNYVHGTIASALASQGIGFSAAQGRVSIGFGLSYVMKDVTLTPPPPADPAKIEQVTISPSFLSLLVGKLGGRAVIDQGQSRLSIFFAMRGNTNTLSFDTKNFNTGKTGIFAIVTGMKGGALVTGQGEFEGDLNVPSTLSGHAELSLAQVVIDPQAIQGFSIPKLNISEGKADLVADKGKVTIRALQLGKKGNAADDIQATVSGDATLGRNWPSSTLNVRTNFSFSETVMKSFSLLDALLGMGKQADGTYAYQLTGPIMAPMFNPVAPK